MDYTRHSSQPATVDLVRADLAEIWTINESEPDSPKRPPSVSGYSEFLDFEYISTPKAPPSKAIRKDPLQDILDGFLEPSPTKKKEGENGTHEARASSKASATQTDKVSVSEQPPSKDSTALDRTSVPVNHPSSPTGPGSIRATQKQGQASKPKAPPPNANKRKRPEQTNEAADTSPTSPSPKPRRQRQPNRKPAPSPPASKGPAKTSTQSKTLREATASARAKPKVRKHDDDVFELSDVTDSEAESRPKKRQAKQPPSKPPAPPARKPQTAERKRNSPTGQGSKPARVPKNPSGRVVPQEHKVEPGPTNSNIAAYADRKDGPADGPNKHGDRNTSPLAKSDPVETTRMEQQTPVAQEADTPTFTSPEPAKPSPVAPREKEPAIPIFSQPREVIILSSASPEASNTGAGSTSPMFVEQDQPQPIPSLSPDFEIADNGKPDADATSPTRLPGIHKRLGFTPPPSFQTRALGNTAVSRRLLTDRPLPAGIREAFFSDEQPAAISPSPVREPETCPDKEDPKPEDIWSQAVEDDSPPAILHRIVSLLYRSLKPREEVVRDIVADYQDNALRFLDNLSERHGQERTKTLLALRQALRASFGVFSGAGQDMAVLINKLRDMDVTYTADALTRPVLAQKLSAVARLSQIKLSNYVRDERYGDGADELEGSLDVLAETYRLKLLDAVRRSDEKLAEASGEVDMRVDDFIKRCLRGETRKVHHAEVREPEKPARNADEALEVLLDGMLHTLQEDRDGAVPPAPGSGVDVAPENGDMAALGFLD